MATEATKTKAIWRPEILTLLQGEGIDIGCGIDPITPRAQRFDQEHGDANRITEFVKKDFDFVFSSHCLEHMLDPLLAIQQWYQLVKPGGHLIVLVPDEDLYEQGCFPSIFNGDHKSTFTISKAKSWSPRSYNLLELAKTLDGEIISLELQDHNYNRRLCRSNPGGYSKWLGRVFQRVARRVSSPPARILLTGIFHFLGAVVDQSNLGDLRLTQIQLIVKKR